MERTQRALGLAAGLTLLCASLGLGANEVVPSHGRIGPASEASRTAHPQAIRQHLATLSQKLPLAFEENRGQSDPQVKFLSRGDEYRLFLTPTEAVLVVRQSKPWPRLSTPRESSATAGAGGAAGKTSRTRTSHREGTAVRMKLVGANATPSVVGLDALPGRANYFLGADPRRWQTDLPMYAKVKYHGVYPGVDVVYYGNQRQLEYDFIVAPGADPHAIQIAFEGARGMILDAHGDLLLETANGTLRLQKPRVYQELTGVTVERAARYVLRRPSTTGHRGGATSVGFHVAAYDATKPLIIDPVLTYSSYLGGSADDRGVSIAVDGAGNAYVTGVTNSPNFPTAGAVQAANSGFGDVFVTKLNATGSAILYSTYLGGSLGDQGNGIAVDAQGNAYITGNTSSLDFPTLSPFQTAIGNGDTFVTKLNPAGSALVYSTYLTGGGNEIGTGIAVDNTGNAYVTGITNSLDFPTLNPVQPALGGGFDAFVTKLNPAGSALVYSTFLGGSNNENGFFVDEIHLAGGIAVDALGNAYVTGETQSPDFPVASPFQATLNGLDDAFVTKLNPAGSALVYSTFLGGTLAESARGIAVDTAGNAYVTGQTSSPDFPTVSPFQATFGGGVGDAFVTKLNPAGSALVYSTFLGGTGFERGLAIAVDTALNAYVAGETDSSGFPIADPVQSTFGGGVLDAFVTKLNPAGSALVYSTFLGGTGVERGLAIAVDTTGNAYVTGYTSSGDFPTASVQAVSGGGIDAFVSKIDVGSGLVVPPDDCFIATAAYGSHLHPHVQALKDLRDRHLMRHAVGRAFVSLYYTSSPPIAAVIAGHERRKLATRVALTPVIYAVIYPVHAGFLALAVVLTGSAWRVRRRRARRRA